jgi:methionyl-tRNA formyltransferase
MSETLELSKPDRWILFGGGTHLLSLAGYLSLKAQTVVIITSLRHCVDIMSEGRTFFDCLKEDGVDYLVSDDVNLDPAVLELIGDTTIGLSVSAPWIFTRNTIDKFGGKLFNSHASNLPQDRGGGGFSWRILRDERFGCSMLHEVVGRIDGGRIVETCEYPFPPEARTPADYMMVAAEKDIANLERLITKVLDGTPLTLTKQDEHLATYWPRLNTDTHSHIDWSWRMLEVERFIRAFDNPYSGARTTVNGGMQVRLKDCHASKTDTAFHPFQVGMVFRKSKNTLHVALIDGSLIVRQLLSEDGVNILEDVRLGDRFFTAASLLEKAQFTRVAYTARGLKEG